MMDPITHILITRKFVGKEPGHLLGGIVADIPFYSLYPQWLLRHGDLKYSLQNDDWPEPPAWYKQTHHIFHSIPLVLSILITSKLLKWKKGQEFCQAWVLHILIDIPTHSHEKWAPQTLWPFLTWTVDGKSWVDILSILFRLISRRNTG